MEASVTHWNDLDIAICSAVEEEIPFALAKAQKEAEKTGNLIYVYENMGLFVMTKHYKELQQSRLVAKIYPGGRTELRGWKP
jgi:L-2-hydroxyglutarate oxidase LhgO